MKNLSTTLKRAFLVLGIIGVAILVCTPAGAGDYGTRFTLSGSDFLARSGLSDNHPGNASSDVGLVISLTRSVSLDLKLSSVGTGQAPTGENQSSPPRSRFPRRPDLTYGTAGLGWVSVLGSNPRFFLSPFLPTAYTPKPVPRAKKKARRWGSYPGRSGGILAEKDRVGSLGKPCPCMLRNIFSQVMLSLSRIES